MNVMEVSEDVVRDRLRKENSEYRQYEHEHNSLESTLASMDAHPYLSPEEEIERKRIQKLKLATKDKMREMVRRYQTGQA